jgi:hypothetical protein
VKTGRFLPGTTANIRFAARLAGHWSNGHFIAVVLHLGWTYIVGFCLLTCTVISLISSGSGRTSNEFQPCSKPCPLAAICPSKFYRMKIIPLILVQLFTLAAIGQTKSFYGEIHIECVIYRGDTLKFDTPKIISFSKLGSTSIISLGKVKQTEFAIQYDLLKSNIGTSEYFMLGKCFFVKTSKGWNEIARFSYDNIIFNEEARPSEILNKNEGTCGAEQDGKGFEFGCWYVFYKT